ncbi:MAG TPA: histidine--tRNA ligase [Candidatus Limnocylindrales bacterium]|nr:histidine--tRNA ligase [Candidatus Limnocylindrales bacterium]
MAEKREFRAIKGTRDILPPDSGLWNWFEQTARKVFESYNFREIRLPIFESTELFARSIGTDTDVASKEMYTFTDTPSFPADRVGSIELIEHVKELLDSFDRDEIPRTNVTSLAIKELREELPKLEQIHQQFEVDVQAGKAPDIDQHTDVVMRVAYRSYLLEKGLKVTLRPEATASVCRAYIEHGMHTLAGNMKLYYVGPMFRRERPQKGRYRQFYQIGAEVLGPSDAPGIDAELLEMLLEFFRCVGLTETALYLNSIGDKNCRPEYVELLRAELKKVKDQLGADSQRRIETNRLRVLDSKLPAEQAVIETLPRISDHLCAECREHFAKLKEELALRGIQYEENWRLVRGLDYYTRTTFEVTAKGLGSQDAVCGGGRYDGLVELLGGPPTKGIGFAIGSDRSILSIQETGKAPAPERLAVFVAWMGAKAYPAAVEIARKLRGAGLSVEVPAEEMKFKKSLGLADKLGARYALILGEDEIATKLFTLKNLADAQQQKMNEGELLEFLESERRG